MKLSKYNLLLCWKNRYFLYNQYSTSIIEIDRELYDYCTKGKLDFDIELQIQLKELGFICDDDEIEENKILARLKCARYKSGYSRVTLIPTLNCNFKCWYCYEKHQKGALSLTNQNSIIKFCEKIIKSGNVKYFHLDWFGGEPLMVKKQSVIPISSKIKLLCEKNNIVFYNSITTNGYLIHLQVIKLFNDVNLNSFQITLDGGKESHNKTRNSLSVTNSFDRIVENITLLCRQLRNPDIVVRINYTPENINTIDSLYDIFPSDIRQKIRISPQLVWQYKDSINPIHENIEDKMEKFLLKNYKQVIDDLRCKTCYVESMSQFVISYDLSVYKCTARDFVPINSIGMINSDGDFIQNNHYYDYYVNSSYEQDKCLKCKFLPSCFGPCIQKVIERSQNECNQHDVFEYIINKVKLYLLQKNIL